MKYTDEIEVIDLDPAAPESQWDEDYDAVPQKKKKSPVFLLTHIALLLVFIAVIAGIWYKINASIEVLDMEAIFADGPGEYEDTMDILYPVLLEAAEDYTDDGELSILFFGNSLFADDRDDEDGVVNRIAAATGATVYNASVSGSYLAQHTDSPNAVEYPQDLYGLYWLVCYLYDFVGDDVHALAETYHPDLIPEDAADALAVLADMDLNTIDVVVISYDATDYFMGNRITNDTDSMDVTTYTGALSAAISLLQLYAPHLRIIVLSPTYAYAIDEAGNYVSSDMVVYGEGTTSGTLASYAILMADAAYQAGVTYIDNIYGTFTEDNAEDYLLDNLHLNSDGRSLVVERFLYALTYFD